MDTSEIYIKTIEHRQKLSEAMKGNTNVLKRWKNHKKMTAICKVCGKEFSRPPSVFKIGNGKYCSQSCANGKPRSKLRHIKQNGYVYLKNYDHPNRDKQNLVAEHRYVVEQKVGHYLTKTEVVHHIDKNPQNNEIGNLFLCKNELEHRRVEKLEATFVRMINLARYEHWDEWSKFDITKNRQDQIQEMILPLGYKIQAKLLYELTNFSRQSRDMNGEYLYPSFEQLWLAFYMYEKHSKVWTGEKWIKAGGE